VKAARYVEGLQTKAEEQPLYSYALFDPNEHENPDDGEMRNMLLIDGDRNDKFVLFDHEKHQEDNGGKNSCGMCHHMNKPLDRATSCFECHRDMFLPADTFDHEFHRTKLDESGGCVQCHTDPAAPKNRATARQCDDCHKTMRVPDSFVQVADKDHTGIAPGYMDAMHKLCIECHKKKETEKVELAPDLGRCGACHQGLDSSLLTVREPYPQQAPAS
jgi:hypothetical protein